MIALISNCLRRVNLNYRKTLESPRNYDRSLSQSVVTAKVHTSSSYVYVPVRDVTTINGIIRFMRERVTHTLFLREDSV